MVHRRPGGAAVVGPDQLGARAAQVVVALALQPQVQGRQPPLTLAQVVAARGLALTVAARAAAA